MPVADTSFLIDVLVGDAAAVALLDGIVDRAESLFIPAPALHELYYGAGRCRRPDEEERRVRELEQAMPVLPFDADAARLAGRVEAALVAKGRPAGRVDVQVLAIAMNRGDRVVTRDLRFPEVEGARVETY